MNEYGRTIPYDEEELQSYNVNPINIKLNKFQTIGNERFSNDSVTLSNNNRGMYNQKSLDHMQIQESPRSSNDAGNFFPALSRNDQSSNAVLNGSYDGSLANL